MSSKSEHAVIGGTITHNSRGEISNLLTPILTTSLYGEKFTVSVLLFGPTLTFKGMKKVTGCDHGDLIKI